MKIAILDDDPVQLEAVAAAIEWAGYRSVSFTRAEALISSLRKDTYDLLILDWNLPGKSGLDVLAWASANLKPSPPMLMVTSRIDDDDIVAALNSGADDYLVKPVARPVLQARINAVLRRAYPAEPSTGVEIYADFAFDITAATATRNGAPIVLTAKEFALAILMFRNLNRPLSRPYISEAVWGNDPTLNSRTLDMHISRVRAKLDLRPQSGYRLTPIYSFGYRLERIYKGGDVELAADGQATE
ncbi:MAG TPA: response regulator transcription factor [Brevundimonas sp.]|nr:response regulator transcription factor [Brevundimonas sp.]